MNILQQQFPVIDQLVHLNHAAVGPWPRVTAEAVNAFVKENEQWGSLHYARWLKTEELLRSRLAELINAPGPEDIALVKNTSEGLSFVASGLEWKRGDNVVGIKQEFPSNRFAWDALSSQGVEFRKLDLETVEDAEQALMDLCDDHTRVISVSSVQYHNGFRLDLARIGHFCQAQGILFCVDAIQHIGALPFDVQAIQADFVVADGHKWMLSAEGLGLFYIRRAILDKLSLQQYGWHMADNLADYDQQNLSPARTARRFECGSPNMLGIHALNSSVEFLLQQDINTIGHSVLANTRFLMHKLEAIPGVVLLSDRHENRLSGIVTFKKAGLSSELLYKKLMEQNVLCAHRGGGVRLSPHFYTPRSQLEQALEFIREVA